LDFSFPPSASFTDPNILRSSNYGQQPKEPRVSGGGWDQVRARLKGDLDVNPMLFVFSNCHDTIRTFPMMQHDPDRPEDMMSDSDDHCVDDVGCSCMSRPFIRPAPRAVSPVVDTRLPTLAELVQLTIRRRGRSDQRI
jgi:hypothetical protein